MHRLTPFIGIALLMAACGAEKSNSKPTETDSVATSTITFDADSAYAYVKQQVDFGPRIPNSEAHAKTQKWLVEQLQRHGAQVHQQKADLEAFDGTVLHANNIIGQYNPEAEERILLLAHYDCRPWADQDPDPANHKKPVDGANDGASGVGVLLEIARQLAIHKPQSGVDILFVDAEDYGAYNNDDSWALGAKYFAEHPFKEGYLPTQAILLDMVGGNNAKFYREHFSEKAAPDLANTIWAYAAEAGFGGNFVNSLGGAVMDDHVQLINAGIPAIDIIEYVPETGFNPTWHTINDNMSNIDRNSLKAVGQTLINYLLR